MPRDILLLPYLRQWLDEGTFPGLLYWVDREKGLFSLFYEHGNRRRERHHTRDGSAAVWLAWAKLKNHDDTLTKNQGLTYYRQRFRQAIKSLVHRRKIELVSSGDKHNQHFRILNESEQKQRLKMKSEKGFQIVDNMVSDDRSGKSEFKRTLLTKCINSQTIDVSKDKSLVSMEEFILPDFDSASPHEIQIKTEAVEEEPEESEASVDDFDTNTSSGSDFDSERQPVGYESSTTNSDLQIADVPIEKRVVNGQIFNQSKQPPSISEKASSHENFKSILPKNIFAQLTGTITPSFSGSIGSTILNASKEVDHSSLATDTKRKYFVIKNPHFNSALYVCIICKRDFHSLGEINSHMNSHVPKGKMGRTFNCNRCDKGFPMRKLLVAHKRTHEDEIRFQCPYCIYNYSRKESLLEHLSQKHHQAYQPTRDLSINNDVIA